MQQIKEHQNTWRKNWQKWKEKIDKYVIIIGDFITSLSVIDRTSAAES